MSELHSTPSSDGIAARLDHVRQRIRDACEQAGREPSTVRLVAVSKTFVAAELLEAARAGQLEFGESYLQEALPKQLALRELAGTALAERLSWHFIGPLQSNKTRDIAAAFDWVHGVDRLRIAERLSAQRPPSLSPLNVFVQVNISGEASKAGCPPAEAPALCRQVAALPGLRLRGLMAIPAPADQAADPREPFRRLTALQQDIRPLLDPAQAAHFDSLSAGMSDDLEAAIAEGSTLVRVGSSIFGDRPRSPG